MPEMLAHVGSRFTVSRRVEKICDTISGGPSASRRMRDTVMLEDLRCDGSGHDGCQAGCRIYWKESWLRRVDPSEEPMRPPTDRLAELERRSRDATRTAPEPGSLGERYRCQATKALDASEPLSAYDPGQYLRELQYGNVGALRFIRVMARALKFGIGRPIRLVGWKPLPFYGLPPSSIRDVLSLRPGSAGLLRVLPYACIRVAYDHHAKIQVLRRSRAPPRRCFAGADAVSEARRPCRGTVSRRNRSDGRREGHDQGAGV